MAEGRIVLRSIVKSKKFMSLNSDNVRLFYLLLIPFTDTNGRIEGDPDLVRAMIYPRRKDIEDFQITKLLSELVSAGLILWYESGDDWFIEIVKFREGQRNLRADREATPTIPGPDNTTGMIEGPRQCPKKIKAPKVADFPNPTQDPNKAPDVPDEFKQKTTPATNDGFDEFWTVYPKKVGKREAKKAWDKLKKERPPTPEIVAKVEALKTTEKWKKEGGQFIPNPATWLNAGGWDDELKTELFEKPPPKTESEQPKFCIKCRRRLEPDGSCSRCEEEMG